MYGAMIGDIVGSIYEFDNIKTKRFPLFSPRCGITDDSIMTAAVARALLRSRTARHMRETTPYQAILVEEMQALGRRYPQPMGGYGGHFARWLRSDDPQPYNSYGNGSAMRVSPCGVIAVTLAEAVMLARATACVTHNHPEGVKGAEAVAAAVFMAREGRSKEEIGAHIRERYYPMRETLDQIRPLYRFDVSCQGTVPQALTAFLESESFEDALRNAVSIGGDSDTIGAITGAVAWEYYGCGRHIFGLPDDMARIREQACAFIPEDICDTADELEETAVYRYGAFDRMGLCTPIATRDEEIRYLRDWKQ